MMLSLAGGQLGCNKKTSAPRTFSRTWKLTSPSLKRRSLTRPNGKFRYSQISLASSGLEEPEKILSLVIPVSLGDPGLESV